MAFSDWTLVFNTSGSSSAQAYNLSLPQPTGSAGSYCRLLINNTVNGTGYSGFYPSDSAFTGVPSTKAIRIQSFMRMSAGCYISLSAKITPGVSFQNSTPPGYHLLYNSNYLTFRIGGVSNSSELDITLSSTQLLNTWYSYRMTVYPISATVDRVICEFESSPGSGIWSSSFPAASGDIIIDKTANPNRFIEWGGSTRNGVFMSPFNSNAAILDMMKVSLANVPVPIP